MFYEAQGIGRFIFETGYWTKSFGIKNARIDLFQQTPLDPALGDLSLSTAGKFIMLEFKVSGNDRSEEKKASIRKRMRDNLYQAAQAPAVPGTFRRSKSNLAREVLLNNHRTYREVSEDCHFLGCFEKRPEDDSYNPYISSIEDMVALRRPIYGQEIFIREHLLDKQDSVGVSLEEFQEYLDMLYNGIPIENTTNASDQLTYCFHVRSDHTISWSCARDLRSLFPQLPSVPKPRRAKP